MSGSITIKLRDVQPSDVPIFFAQQLDPEANRMAAFVRENPQDIAGFNSLWKRILDSSAIVKKTVLHEDKVVGHISCYPQDGEREVTYWIGKEHWGRGIATEALKNLLQEVTHRPLFARAAKDNIGSVKVLQKCGFKVVGENTDFAAGRGEQTEEYILCLEAARS